MLGEWTSTSFWMQPDQSLQEVQARHRFQQAFGGQGVVDDNFKLVPASQTSETSLTYWGTAIRTYDPEADAWTCRWYDGELKSWTPEFVLRSEGDAMTGEIEGSDQHGTYVDRIQFQPTSEDAVNWTMVRHYDGLPQSLMIGQIAYRRIAARAAKR